MDEDPKDEDMNAGSTIDDINDMSIGTNKEYKFHDASIMGPKTCMYNLSMPMAPIARDINRQESVRV